MTGPNDGSDEPDRPDEPPENPDQPTTDPDQHQDDSDNPTREVRTDGGEVLTAPGQDDQHTPQPRAAQTPDSPEIGRSKHTDTGPASEANTSKSERSPTNIPENTADSASTNTPNGDQLFSGAVSVDDVVEFYLDTNPWDLQTNTVTAYRTRLRHFQEFCTEHDIEELGDVQPDTLDEFQNYLHEESALEATSSIKGCLAALRKFLKYCEHRGVFDHGFHKLVILPTVSKHEGQDERWLSRETAEEIVDHLETYRPFTKAHVVWAILAETGIRQSTLYALDLDDYDAYDCPESLSPHPVRRGYITHLRANGVPTEDVISKRCDANPDTIEQWYDMSTESDRREARREYVEDL